VLAERVKQASATQEEGNNSR